MQTSVNPGAVQAHGGAVISLADGVRASATAAGSALGSARSAVGDPVLAAAVGNLSDTAAVAYQCAQLALAAVGMAMTRAGQDYQRNESWVEGHLRMR